MTLAGGPRGRVALILFGHGARDPEWSIPLQKIQVAVCERHPESRVAVAFLEFIEPSLAQCVADLHDEGIHEFRILPIFIARSGHLKRDLAGAVDALRRRFPECVFHVALAVGEEPRVIEAMADCAKTLLDDGNTGR